MKGLPTRARRQQAQRQRARADAPQIPRGLLFGDGRTLHRGISANKNPPWSSTRTSRPKNKTGLGGSKPKTGPSWCRDGKGGRGQSGARVSGRRGPALILHEPGTRCHGDRRGWRSRRAAHLVRIDCSPGTPPLPTSNINYGPGRRHGEGCAPLHSRRWARLRGHQDESPKNPKFPSLEKGRS